MTTIQQLLGIALPVIQAPMAGVQDSRLAIAVSNAGGLGSVPCAMLGTDGLRRELEAVRAGTGKPVNINFFSHRMPQPDAARAQAWKDALLPYYAELGVAPDSGASGAARMPFSADSAAVLAEFRPAVVSFHFGLPDEPLLQSVRQSGARILGCATTIDEARWLAARGVDAIIAQGLEAGGHRGSFLSPELTRQMGTFALVRQLAREVRVPVIAAGGIADAEGVAAALALGAAGAQVGTAYLLCPEATTRDAHRAALESDAARHTAITNVFTGRPARGIVNRIVRELGPLSPLAPEFPLAAAALAPLRAQAEAQGSSDFSPLWAGQNVAGCRKIPAAELTMQLGRLAR